jgi:organic radical activating enzyme
MSDQAKRFSAEIHANSAKQKIIRIKSLISGNTSDYSLIRLNGKHKNISEIENSELQDLVADLNESSLQNIGTSSILSFDPSLLTEIQIQPDNILHSETYSEKSYTSTGEKLDYHWPIFKKYSETGYGSIIRATVTNHQKCSSRCSYCSTIHRNNADSISLSEFKGFIDKLTDLQGEYNKEHFPEYNTLYKKLTGRDISLRGLIFSGGGQPNLWPHFEEAVEYAKSKDLELGLITNGFPKNISESIYRHFEWIRLSITPVEASPFYLHGSFRRQPLPSTITGSNKHPNLTVGISYVYGPWTKDHDFHELSAFVSENNWDYCRLLVDCNLERNQQLSVHNDLSQRLRRLDLLDAKGTPKTPFFHQLKYHGTPEEATRLWNDSQCKLQVYNVFWDTTGHDTKGFSYCYPCDSVTVLSDEGQDTQKSARMFDATTWGTYPNTQVEKLFTERVTPFFDPKEKCKSCLFMKNNQQVIDIVSRSTKYPDGYLPSSNLTHVNFP